MGIPSQTSISSDKNLYQSIYNYSQDGVLIVRPETFQILFLNTKQVDLSGHEESDLYQLSFLDLFFDEDIEAIKTILESTIQWKTGLDPLRIMKRGSGRKLYIEMTTSLVNFEMSDAIMVTVRDISERVKHEKKIKKYSEQLEQLNSELEAKVEERTQKLKHANDDLVQQNTFITNQKKEISDIMNNIHQGIITIAPNLIINKEFSSFMKVLFPQAKIAGQKISTFLYQEGNEDDASVLDEALETIFSDPSLWDMVEELLPKEINIGNREITLSWVPIIIGEKVLKFLLIFTDVTEERELQREISSQKEENDQKVEILLKLLKYPKDVLNKFVSGATKNLNKMNIMLQKPSWSSSENLKELFRILHTLKGAANQMGLQRMANECHLLEDQLGLDINEQKFLRDVESLDKQYKIIFNFYEKTTNSSPEIESSKKDKYKTTFVQSLLKVNEQQELLRKFMHLEGESVDSIRENMADLVDKTSTSLGKDIRFEFESETFFLDKKSIGDLNDALSHIVRNAIDHGIDQTGDLKIKFENNKYHLLIQIIDNGKGIDIEKLTEKIISNKIKTESKLNNLAAEEIIQYVFHSGLSTRDNVSDISGRGVGLDAVKNIIENDLNGKVYVTSLPNKGTIFHIMLPTPLAMFEGQYLEIDKQAKVFKSYDTLKQLFSNIDKYDHFIYPANTRFHQLEKTTSLKYHHLYTWGMEVYLNPNYQMMELKIKDFKLKSHYLDQVYLYLSSHITSSTILNAVIETCDELIMNAIFDAPRNLDGSVKYNHLSRSKYDIVLENHEQGILKIGFDKDFLAISMEDPFGSLTKETVVKYIYKAIQTENKISNESAGAGLGLSQIFLNSNYMVINSCPGKRNEMISLINLAKTNKSRLLNGHSFSFFEHPHI